MAAAIVFKTAHRIRFSDLDPYDHMSTANYATYYVDHRMQGLHEKIGWDSSKLATLPFMAFVRRLEIDFIRPLRAGQEVTITSFVREFRGPDALVECTMTDAAGKPASRCLMTVAFVDRDTSRAKDWPADVVALFYEED